MFEVENIYDYSVHNLHNNILVLIPGFPLPIKKRHKDL